MESLKGLLDGFDPTKILPDLEAFQGTLEVVLRIAVMVAPLVLLGLGLVYFLAPPKEANYTLGYRCRRGMASVEAWQFTQRLAGMVWSALGLVLCVIMAILCSRYRNMDANVMVWSAVKSILWELGLVIASCVGINITVIVYFDKTGTRRPPKGASESNT